eukprot:286389_1
MAVNLQHHLSVFHCYILWICTAAIAGLSVLNWFLVLNRLNINININDPNINTINQYQDNTLGDLLKTYYNYKGRVMAYVLVFVYIVLPTIQLISRCICLYFKLNTKKRFHLLSLSTTATVTSLLIPYSSLIQAVSINGDITNEYGTLQFGFENKHGLVMMFINSYLSFFLDIYLLYLHWYKCVEKENGLHLNESIIVNESKDKNLIEFKDTSDDTNLYFYMLKRNKVYIIFPLLLIITLILFIYSQFIDIFRSKFIGYLIQYVEHTLHFELSEIKLSAYDIYDKFPQFAYYDNDNFITSKIMVWIFSIVYLFGNILLPIWVLVLLTFLWFVPFKKENINKFNTLWNIIFIQSLLITPPAFITVVTSLVIFQKRVTTAYFYSQAKDICVLFNENGICLAAVTYLTNNFILYAVSMVLVVTIIAISYKAVSIYNKKNV